MEIDKIKINPNNPRFIKDEKFKSLVKSLIELPVMTDKKLLLRRQCNYRKYGIVPQRSRVR